jgi:hypothetical protein
MRYISNFNIFLNESQSKKLRKYFTFSVVLEWYRKNKEKIAKTLNCDVSDLASEDTLMEQSYGVVNYVINPQSRGNDGRDNIEIAGFSDFQKLEKNLIHDILHNMYHVQSKEFNKSLENIQYSESEIFEEIEVLGIEESFMKYMNIPYPKTDFINQNLNMLASYMMMSILKNDPNRIEKILDGEIEPYLEVYGKKYQVEGTPYENFFKLFTNDKADYNFRINNSDDFKEYMIHLLNVSSGIDDTLGDRANYPNFDYFGEERFEDLSNDEIGYIIRKYSEKHILIEDDFGATLTELGFETRLVDDIEIEDPNQIKLFPEYDKKQQERDELSKIPIPKSAIDEDGFIDTDIWFDFLENEYNINLYSIDDRKYLAVGYDENYETYTIFDSDEFLQELADYYDSYYGEKNLVSTSKEFIDYNKYREYSFEKIAKMVVNDDTARSIMRRNFRTNDVIKNNTKLGNLYTSHWDGWKQKEINTKNIKDKYTDFTASDLASDKSISKMILTDNGKRLIYLLNDLRGYFLKNIENIKSNYKEKSKKFDKEIDRFRNINLNNLKNILDSVSKMDFEKDSLEVDITINYNWSNRKELTIQYNDEISTIEDFVENFKDIKNFKDLVKTKEDVEYLLNYVNEKGLLKTPLDFSKFRSFVTKLKKYESKIENYKFNYIIDILKSKRRFNVNNESIDKIKNYIENLIEEGVDKVSLKTDKKLIEYSTQIIKDTLKLDIKKIEIINVDGLDVDLKITL